MMKMSWTHSSKVIALGVLLAVALGAAGTAAAISFTDDSIPDETQENESVTWTVTMEEPYNGPPSDEYTLRAKTDLSNADITLTARDLDQNTVAQTSEESNQADILISKAGAYDNDVADVVIEVSGKVPTVSAWNYEDKSAENFLGLELTRVEGGDEITLAEGDATWEVHRFNEDSKEAREAIASAEEVVSDSGNEDAQSRLDEAKVHYNNGEFQNAIDAADEAENTAESEGETTQLLLMAGGVVLVIALLGGGLYVWRQQKDDTNKLQ
jgi:hypothetical protein